MQIESIRVYSEVLEQGLDFKEYIIGTGFQGNIVNIYTKKARAEFNNNDSLVDRIRKVKDIDILLTVISDNLEYPLLLVEYSTAVPTDDHKMQRSDVYFWGATFGVPMMKISPTSKGMAQSFGGGSRISDDIERAIAYRKGAVLYPISWNTPNDEDVLPTKEGALSCINYSKDIHNILTTLISTFTSYSSFELYYEALRKDYSHNYDIMLSYYTDERLKSVIVNSNRFQWNNNKLCAKINRFGHAMDPDRGVLYFVNMLVGTDNTITEIQVNRPANYDCRGGYRSLFDALPRQSMLKRYVENIIVNQHNHFTDDNAIYIFKHALNIENVLSFRNLGNHNYIIDDKVLLSFLINHPSMTSKSIFYLSTELRLTDIDRNIICTIKWNRNPIEKYLATINANNFSPIPIKPLSIDEAKEDIITFASVELYKKIQCSLLAVSYPGAQGDRCILTGQGRNVLRTYIDIIAYKTSDNGIKVYLEECKDNINKSLSDVAKLQEIYTNADKRKGLVLLFNKIIHIDDIGAVYRSIGTKVTRNIPNYDLDYIFMFDISNTENSTSINYSVAVINTGLIPEFMPLSEDGKRLKGSLIYDKIYIIDQN